MFPHQSSPNKWFPHLSALILINPFFEAIANAVSHHISASQMEVEMCQKNTFIVQLINQ
jgi:hypothetical protein